MNNRTYGILMGVIGSAIGAWWFSRQRRAYGAAPSAERGQVIFDNTPTATRLSEGR